MYYIKYDIYRIHLQIPHNRTYSWDFLTYTKSSDCFHLHHWHLFKTISSCRTTLLTHCLCVFLKLFGHFSRSGLCGKAINYFYVWLLLLLIWFSVLFSLCSVKLYSWVRNKLNRLPAGHRPAKQTERNAIPFGIANAISARCCD